MVKGQLTVPLQSGGVGNPNQGKQNTQQILMGAYNEKASTEFILIKEIRSLTRKLVLKQLVFRAAGILRWIRAH